MPDDENDEYDDAQEEDDTRDEDTGGEGRNRTFFSATSAASFFRQYETVMERQQKAAIQAQDRLIQQINEPVVALTAKLDILLQSMRANKRRTSSNPSSDQGNPRIPPSNPPPLNPPPLNPPPLNPPPLGPPTFNTTPLGPSTFNPPPLNPHPFVPISTHPPLGSQDVRFQLPPYPLLPQTQQQRSQSEAVLANERIQIRSDPLPGLSV